MYWEIINASTAVQFQMEQCLNYVLIERTSTIHQPVTEFTAVEKNRVQRVR